VGAGPAPFLLEEIKAPEQPLSNEGLLKPGGDDVDNLSMEQVGEGTEPEQVDVETEPEKEVPLTYPPSGGRIIEEE